MGGNGFSGFGAVEFDLAWPAIATRDGIEVVVTPGRIAPSEYDRGVGTAPSAAASIACRTSPTRVAANGGPASGDVQSTQTKSM
jgi:hypothetical protein